MDKNMKTLRSKLNKLEKDSFNCSDNLDMLSSENRSINDELDKVMTYFKKHYRKAYDKTVNKLDVMTLEQGIKKLKYYKNYFEHKDMHGQYKPSISLDQNNINSLKTNGSKLIYLNKYDGSLYELDSIDYFFMRVIINTLRMFAKVPLTKREVYKEVAIDMTYDSDPIESGLMNGQCGDISDQGDMAMAQDSCNTELNQAVSDLRPKVKFLKSINNSDTNWFIVTDVKYSLESNLDDDLAVTTQFKPTNEIKDKITDTSDVEEFENYLKGIHVPLPSEDPSDVSDESDFNSDSDFDDFSDSDMYLDSDDLDSDELWSDNSDFFDEFDDDIPVTPAPDLDDPQELYNQINHLYNIIMEIPEDSDSDNDVYY